MSPAFAAIKYKHINSKKFTEKGKSTYEKILAFILAAVMVLSLAACADKGSEGGATSPSGAQTNQPKSALEILEKVWSKYSTDEKFPATGGSENT